MITNRDKKVVEFLDQYKVARSSTLNMFYPSKRVMQKRLKVLADTKIVKRERYTVSDEYIYYFNKKPKQLLHDILLTDFYRELEKQAKILKFIKEFNRIEGIRPDAFIAYEKTQVEIAFVEVEISNKGLDLEKYNRIYTDESYLEHFPVFPHIFIITDNKVNNPYEFKVKTYPTDLNSIKLV